MGRRGRALDVWCAGFIGALGLSTTGLVACDDEGRTFPCENPVAVEVGGSATGLETCDGGFVHRAEATTCPTQLPRADITCEDGGTGTCTTDADCTARPNGYCSVGFFEPSCSCTYGCTTDDECEAGQLCLCGDPVGRCVPAECQTDDDCPGDLLCTGYDASPGCSSIQYACQTTSDECGGDGDCADGEACSVKSDRRECVAMNCVIGRPFIVDGEDRMAEPCERSDWRSEDAAALAVDHLPAALRAELAEHWTQIGLMEHAAIAAFARSALQLLALGAPPELLQETHAALADETHHARLCFALASRYAGRDIGPGPLDIEGAVAGCDLREMLHMVIREGCLGETIAALEAREGLVNTDEPVLDAVLTRIHEDERKHGLLAWRTLRWALEQGDASLRGWVAREFEIAIAEQTSTDPLPPTPAHEDALLPHGVVGPIAREHLRAEVLERVVRPCIAAMLATEDRTLPRA